MTDNYKVIADKLANREPFNGNSLRAFINEYDSTTPYVVVSYGTVIAMATDPTKTLELFEAGWLKSPNALWVCPKKYSVTTSRHQNLIKRAWGIK